MREASFLRYFPRVWGERSAHDGWAAFAEATAALVSASEASWTVVVSCINVRVETNPTFGHEFMARWREEIECFLFRGFLKLR